MALKTKGHWFVDQSGRRLMLRGVNVSGSSKVPFAPDGATFRKEHFFDHRNVSFVGRPFPLDEADEHFNRLRYWGLTTLRFLTITNSIQCKIASSTHQQMINRRSTINNTKCALVGWVDKRHEIFHNLPKPIEFYQT